MHFMEFSLFRRGHWVTDEGVQGRRHYAAKELRPSRFGTELCVLSLDEVGSSL